MRHITFRAGAIATVATITLSLLNAEGSGAAAQDLVSAAPILGPQVQAQFIAQPVVQPLKADTAPLAEPAEGEIPAIDADTLAELVVNQPRSAELSREMTCLATAIYFEAKSETLEGQLAVGRVIVARSKSGRFPGSYCGVVLQRSQFSFVRGGGLPALNRASRDWQEAAAIAQIADSGSWRSPVEGALFFHASHVSPNWRLKRMARVDNHVFYR